MLGGRDASSGEGAWEGAQLAAHSLAPIHLATSEFLEGWAGGRAVTRNQSPLSGQLLEGHTVSPNPHPVFKNKDNPVGLFA